MHTSSFVNVVSIKKFMNHSSALELLIVFLNSFALLRFTKYVENLFIELNRDLANRIVRQTLFLLFFPCAYSITRLCNFYSNPLFLFVLSLGTTSVKSKGGMTSMSKSIGWAIRNEHTLSVITKMTIN